MKGIVTKEMLRGLRLVEGAFAENEELTEIELPDFIEDIGEVAFFGCRKLRKITLPQSIRVIREEAFGESGLTEIRIPERAEEICEKAFFSCEDLRRIEIPSPDTVIGKDAFGSCPVLTEGYAACGYPAEPNPPEELLFTLLWCSCPDRHTDRTSRRAEAFIRSHEGLIMERIFKSANTAALSGIAGRGLLSPENIDSYIEKAYQRKQTEIAALLLAAAQAQDTSGEFDL